MSESPVLVEQPTGAPTRKTFGGFVTAIIMAFMTKTLVALYPGLLDAGNPWQPLYIELLTWLPIIVPTIQYQLKEWASPPVAIVPASDTPTVVNLTAEAAAPAEAPRHPYAG